MLNPAQSYPTLMLSSAFLTVILERVEQPIVVFCTTGTPPIHPMRTIPTRGTTRLIITAVSCCGIPTPDCGQGPAIGLFFFTAARLSV